MVDGSEGYSGPPRRAPNLPAGRAGKASWQRVNGIYLGEEERRGGPG